MPIRMYEAQSMENHHTVVDLFCGAGGLALGFQRAGFHILRGFDHDEAAARTYVRNLGGHIVCETITVDTQLPQASVVIGGPPCQGFSSAGLRRSLDERNSLIKTFAYLVAKHRPKAFLFENVEGFLTADKGNRIIDLLTPLLSAGYRIHLRKVNAADYGIPQHRKRVVAVGGLGWNPTFPAPTHRSFGAPGSGLVEAPAPDAPTLADAISLLPPPTDSPPGDPPDHYFRPICAESTVRIRTLKPGQRMRDLPEDFQHPSYRRRAFRRVMDGTPTERRGGPPAGLLRLRWDEPCKAVTGGAKSELIHPCEDRFLTIRECAMIQTFPMRYEFVGAASQRIRQIGNAVPPKLAEVFARSLMTELDGAVTSHSGGALLSFSPFHSNGISPALADVFDIISKEFGPIQRGPGQLSLWG